MSIHPSTFEQVFHQFRTPLIFFARSLIKNKSEAEDIVTKVFIKFFQSKNHYESVTAKKYFLYQCTKNECIDYLRREVLKRKHKEYVEASNDEQVESVLNEITDKEIIVQIKKIIECLPPVCKRIMNLYYKDGFTREEVAQLLGLSTNTVRNHVAEGLKKIRTRLKELEMADASPEKLTIELVE